MIPPTSISIAKMHLNPVARRIAREHEGDFWEDETMTLPFTIRRLRRKYRKFADEYIRPQALPADKDLSTLDRDKLFLAYAKHGFATETMPRPVGSLPLSAIRHGALAAAMKIEELCAACPGLGIVAFAHDLGFAPILISASPAAYWRWIRTTYKKLKRGEKCCFAFAITEPGIGSDAEDTQGAMKAKAITRAVKVPDGYIINGRKTFITNGAIADYATVFACLNNEGMESWTCFVVDKKTEGYSLGRQEKKMGQKAADASEIILEDVFVPDANRIGAERSGWALNRLTLNVSRPMVAAICLGIARSALDQCTEFCSKTYLGPKLLIQYQDVQLELANMFSQVLAGRALTWHVATRFMPPYSATSGAAKSYCADMAFAVSSKAMEIMGDHSYIHANGVEKTMRDARLTQIYEGTNEMNRLAVAEDLWERFSEEDKSVAIQQII